MKRIRRLLTSRLISTAISIIVQFVIIILLIYYFDGAFVGYYAFYLALAMIMCVYIINNKQNSDYKIAWILLLLGLPVFGVTVFFILDGRLFTRLKRRKMLAITNRVKDLLIGAEEAEIEDGVAKGQSDYIRAYCYSPPLENTKTKYLSGGEQYFDSLLKDLESAKRTIFMEYFIIKEGQMWDKIKEILIKKAAQGVDVRLIYDDFGSIDRLRRKEIKELKKNGIKVKSFNPFVPILSTVLNNRDHRKICTVDSVIAYCGGINIGDEYINMDKRERHFKDSGIVLYGEGAFTFEAFFIALWEHLEGKTECIKRPNCECLNCGVVQPYTDSPVDTEPLGKNVYLNLINRARKYVYISTPYFVVDEEMLHAITNAAKNGVDVRIILPHIPDKWAVNQVTKSYYERLIFAGVKVYEYKRGFNHSKIVVSDDKIATVGSVNFDYRSFYLSFECGVWLYDGEVINDVLLDFNTMQCDSIKISLESCRVNVLVRLFRAILASVAPLF